MPWPKKNRALLFAQHAAYLQETCEKHNVQLVDVLGKRRWKPLVQARKDIAVGLFGFGLSYNEIGAILYRHHTTVMNLCGCFEQSKKKDIPMAKGSDKKNQQQADAAPQVKKRPARLGTRGPDDAQRAVQQRNEIVRKAAQTHKKLEHADRRMKAVEALLHNDNGDAQFYFIGVVSSKKLITLEDGIWFSELNAQEALDAGKERYSEKAGVHGFKGSSQDLKNLLAITAPV